jgi:phosphatidylglycerophosphatase A
MNQTILRWVRRIGASIFFVGYFPVAPGSVASALMVAALWFSRDTSWYQRYFATPAAAWIASLALVAISFFLTENTADTFGEEDSPHAVIDEWAGQCITFLMIPLNWRTLLLGFVLFRFFDIVKPYPAHKLEQAEGGVGVTMDDVAAGVMANLSLFATLWIYHAIKPFLYR